MITKKNKFYEIGMNQLESTKSETMNQQKMKLMQ